MNKNIFTIYDNSNKKLTYTDIVKTIPNGHVYEQITDWKNKYKTEWRWRFLDLDEHRRVVEISKIDNNTTDRLYYTNGEWYKRDIDAIYDNCVVKLIYYYT